MAKPSKEGMKFNELCWEHEDRFGKHYGVHVGDTRPLLDHIAILEEALRTGTPAEPWVPNLPKGAII